VTGRGGSHVTLVTDVPRWVVDDRFRFDVPGLGLRGAALLAAAGPGRLPVPVRSAVFGVDAGQRRGPRRLLSQHGFGR